MSNQFVKDPNALLEYSWDWSDWLRTGETISTSTMVVPTGITNTLDTNDDTSATVWLSGGTVGATYQITNRITTNQGRTDDRSILIMVRER